MLKLKTFHTLVTLLDSAVVRCFFVTLEGLRGMGADIGLLTFSFLRCLSADIRYICSGIVRAKNMSWKA